MGTQGVFAGHGAAAKSSFGDVMEHQCKPHPGVQGEWALRVAVSFRTPLRRHRTTGGASETMEGKGRVGISTALLRSRGHSQNFAK